MTPSSEAFAVLCLENYYDNIQDIASNRSTVRKPLWTCKGLGAKRNQGWSLEGLNKFDTYCKKVGENRSDVNLKMVDTTYWKERQARIERSEARKRKRELTRKERESGWEVAHVDDWSDDDKTTQQTHNDSTVEQGNEKDAEESDNEEDGSIH
jgi:hypothetical protein